MNINSQKILIVDDDFAICDILQKMLKREGFQTVVATTGSQALTQFAENPIDLVLLDLMIPDVSGLDLARKFLEDKPHVPIILLSAYGTVSKAVEATKMGIYDFLEKPLDRDRIIVNVHNALARGKLEQELAQYKQEMLKKFKMVGQSKAIREVCALIERVAATDTPVLITGENGTGKELVASAIHASSLRSVKPFVTINCAAIPTDILESELFGHTKGAFTGALAAKRGRFEIANYGTLFLDEIGDMDERMQVKLLRFLEEGEIQKVGSTEIQQLDVRMIFATNHDLKRAVDEKRFRQDLYYRVNVVHINIPPLRDRRVDIPLLVEHFAKIYAESHGIPVPHFTPASMRVIRFHPWPGNVRQVRNFIERILVLNYHEIIDLEDIKPYLESPNLGKESPSKNNVSLQAARQQFEREYILEALQQAQGSVSQAAQNLGMDRANLYRKMRQLGIDLDELRS